MVQRQQNIFDQTLALLQERKFSLALKIASDGARQFKLYHDYQKDFANIRLLAYEAHDWALAAEKLTMLLNKLSNELNGSAK